MFNIMFHIFHLILDILIFTVFYSRYCLYQFVGENKKEGSLQKDNNQTIID